MGKSRRKSVKRVLSEGKIENWQPDDFVTWDDVQSYVNHDADFCERNWRRCERLGIPKDCRCGLCQKELKRGYKTLYIIDNTIDYYAHPQPNSHEIKVFFFCYIF